MIAIVKRARIVFNLGVRQRRSVQLGEQGHAPMLVEIR